MSDNEIIAQITTATPHIAEASNGCEAAITAYNKAMDLTTQAIVDDIDLLIEAAQELKTRVQTDAESAKGHNESVMRGHHNALTNTHDFHSRIATLRQEWEISRP
jgi:hypothetical protein